MKRHVQCRRSYALEAERKMGQMLKETERAKGAMGNPGGRGAKLVRSQDVTAQPTLLTLGLSKRESAEAQLLAELSEATRTRSLIYDALAGTLRAKKGHRGEAARSRLL